MTVYGIGLFVHVVFAILLVGGSAYAHLTTALLRRATTVDGVRSHLGWLQAFLKASGPVAGLVLGSGLYLAFVGRHWGAGWPFVSLVLFALGGIAAMAILDPRIGRMRAAVDEVDRGPVPPALRTALRDRTTTLVSWTLGGADLAIVFLMTNKPGWAGSIVTAGVGLVAGAAVGVREARPTAHAEGPPAAAPPAPAV